jgi:ankyrin repeat protein
VFRLFVAAAAIEAAAAAAAAAAIELSIFNKVNMIFRVISLLALLFVSGAQKWEDNEVTSALWRACSMRDTVGLTKMLQQDQNIAHVRSADGRGPLFWAYEFDHKEAIEMLERLGADNMATDVNGLTPIQIGIDNAEINAKRNAPVYADPLDDDDDDDYDDYGDL